MNAFFELFGDRCTVHENDSKSLNSLFSLDKADIVETTDAVKKRNGAHWSGIRNKRTFEIWPHNDAPIVREWIDNVKWASVRCSYINLSLKSKRSKEDEEAFLKGLRDIEYDDGYGSQELFGVVVFNDGRWLTRYEYDGSESWQLNSCPEEPDWNDFTPYLF